MSATLGDHGRVLVSTPNLRTRLALLGGSCVLALAAFAGTPAVASGASDAVSCSSVSSEWLLRDVDEVAAAFFPYLYTSYGFENDDEFAAAIAELYDVKSPDGLVCAKVSKGADLNPKSHWYLQEVPLEGNEDGGPVYFLRVRENK